MAQENIEVILKGIEATNRRDADAFVACLHPDVEWVLLGFKVSRRVAVVEAPR